MSAVEPPRAEARPLSSAADSASVADSAPLVDNDTASDPYVPGVIAAELRIALMRSVRRLRAEKADDDLSDTQYAVLALLDRVGPATPSALADHERVQPPSMSRTLNSLLERHLVARQSNPTDGRQVIVTLTAEGQHVVHATRARRDEWLARRLAALNPDERQVLAAASTLLRRIADS